MRRSAGGHRKGRAAAAQHDRTGGRRLIAAAARVSISGAGPCSPSGDFVQVPPEPINCCTAFRLAIGPAISPSRSRTFQFVRLETYTREELVAGWPAPSSVHRRQHRATVGMPITSARGSKCCARTITRHRPRCQCRVKAADYILGFQSVTQQRAETPRGRRSGSVIPVPRNAEPDVHVALIRLHCAE
jgi:hypothetical protein